MDHQIYTLRNGLRILLKPAPSGISHACIMINAGSRDEPDGKEGLAHLIEHLLFKRTEKRSTNQILNRLELVGADLNAYTTKEYTCIHASFLNEYLERVLDLFEDLAFHSVFPVEEVKKEKSVIMDEISSYLDQPEEAIQDDFEELLFKSHPLGRNILGTSESVNILQRLDIVEFIKCNYRTDEIVIGIIGNYEFQKVVRSAEKIFGNVPANLPKRDRKMPELYQKTELKQIKPINQSHAVIGNQAYSIHHPSREALLLLNNLLGGMGMSSRLNLEIREKYGIAYTIESNFIPLSDTGMFSIYLGTDPEKLNRAVKLVNRELRLLREKSIGSVQLHRAKQKFMGQVALAEENRLNLIISLSKTLIDYGSIDPLEVFLSKINQISAKQISDVANEILDPKQLSCLIFEPADG